MNKNLQKTYKDELNISKTLRIIWHGKYFYFLIVIVSLLFSIYNISSKKPLYEAEAVIELRSDSGSSNSMISNYGLRQLLPGIKPISSSSSFVPKILGAEFLLQLSKDLDLKVELDKYCRYSKPSKLSIIGFLNNFSDNKFKNPTEQQLITHKLNCIRSFIDVENFISGKMTTEAFVLKITHSDPFFSAKLANSIVNKFFKIEEARVQSEYESVRVFLNETLSLALKDLNEAKLEYEQFLADNIDTIEKVGNANTLSYQIKPFKEFKSVPFLEKYKADIGETIKGLSKYNLSDTTLFSIDNLETDLNEIFPSLSQKFVSSVKAILQNNLYRENEKDQMIDEIVIQEKKRLNNLLNKVSINLKNIKIKMDNELKNIDRLKKLETNVEASGQYYSTLKLKAQESKLSAGLDSLKQNYIHSYAKVPFSPVSPNAQLIISVNLIIGIVLMTVFLIVKQSYLRKIFSIQDIEEAYEFNSLMSLPQKVLKRKDHLSEVKYANYLDNFGILNSLSESASLIYLIDLSEGKGFRNSSASSVATFLARYLPPTFEIKILTNNIPLNSSNPDGVISSFKTQSQPENKKQPQFEYLDPESINSGALSLDSYINNPNKKIFICSDNRQNDRGKLDIIKKCDFFLLIGRRGQVSEKDVSKYNSLAASSGTKCEGFVLIT